MFGDSWIRSGRGFALLPKSNPKLGGGIRNRKLEVQGHDPYDLVFQAVQLNRAAKHRRSAGEPFLPKLITQQDAPVPGLVLLFGEDTSERGRDAEQLENLRGDSRSLDPGRCDIA